jgi:hypothetical protein
LRTSSDRRGIGVEESHPLDALDLRELPQHRGETVPQAELGAVAGGVLGDENELFDALRRAIRLPPGWTPVAAAVRASDLGDDAERAGIVAALGYLQIGIVRRGREDPGRGGRRDRRPSRRPGSFSTRRSSPSQASTTVWSDRARKRRPPRGYPARCPGRSAARGIP